jgi:hypothetical protein
MVRENVDRARPRIVSTSSIIWSTSNNGPTGIACKNYAVHFESMGSILSIPFSGTWIDERISRHNLPDNGTIPQHIEPHSKGFCRVFGLSTSREDLVSLVRPSVEYSSAAGISTHIFRSKDTRSIGIGCFNGSTFFV